MSSYVSNVYVALLLFPFLAALLVVPYAIYEYRRYGSIPWLKTVLVFTMVFYLMCAYFMVILPLPADRDIYIASVQTPQLVPFSFVADIASKTALDPTSPRSWIAWLRSPEVYTVLFNFLLTAPFGAYLRYLLRRPWWQALLAGFGLALLFEVSQGTGLFGIYAHPYRLFDVDDLITNTTGAMLGYWLSIPLCRFLPSIERMNELAVERAAARTSAWRRFIAFCVDWVAYGAVSGLLRAILPSIFPADAYGDLALAMASTGLVFVLAPVITRGATIGHGLLRLSVVRPDGSPASRASIAVRYLLLFWCFLLAPRWMAALTPAQATGEFASADAVYVVTTAMSALVALVQGVWVLSIGVRALLCHWRNKPFVMLNGVITNTRVYSAEQIKRLRG